MAANRIKVEVVYASKLRQEVIPLEVEQGSSVEDAIKKSGVLQIFPEINLQKSVVGIFSQRVNLERRLEKGNRIEIYRPLLIDPKQARLQRSVT